MKPLDQLHEYLDGVRRRLLASAVMRGAAIAAVCALIATVTLVLIANYFAFSGTSVTWSRVLLFLVVAFAVAFGIIAPVLALTRRRAAKAAEEANPAFDQRLITCVESEPSPILNLLARDTLKAAESSTPSQLVPSAKLAGFSGAAAIAAGVLGWLVLAGPGYMGYGAALLWGGVPKTGAAPYYDIQVTPGDKLVRRKSDQVISANLIGFQTATAKLKARYKGSSKWEDVQMIPSQSSKGFEFLFSALPEEVDYYVEAGQIRSKQYKLSVVDLPSVKRIVVTYNYPKWTGQSPRTEDPGGDLRAIEGTEADLTIETDRPLVNGTLALEDGTEIKLDQQSGNLVKARVPIQKDGTYHLATIEQSQPVRLTDDYFIEAQKETEPTVRLSRPGRDLKASPIEEVTLEATADDDFGLHELQLHYSVNGGAEKTVDLLAKRGVKSASDRKMLALEEFKLIPGDVISVYATAKDARTTARTDIYFIEAQPFEREFTQSQQAGGGGGGEEGGEQNQIAQRQKEIIAATWNEIRNKSGDKRKALEDSKFLTDVQSKLQAQALTLAQRMRARQLAGAAEAFAAFAKDMESASKAMGPAAENLKALKWQEALPHEQQALQHLLRAEARFKEIQVAFGQQGGGGGAGSSGRDLESLFDLELDTEKNQYETGQQQASGGDRQKEIDEALQRLEQLARRQQELAQQQNQNRQLPEQRWQQEQLRREAEKLRQQMQQLAQQQGQQGQQGQQQSRSQQGQSGQSGQQGGQQQQQQQLSPTQQRLSAMANPRNNQSSSGRTDPRIQRALDQLSQATDDMRRANQGGQQNEAETRRAAERLQEAKNLLGGMRRDESSSQLGDLARRTDDLAQQQRKFADDLKNRFGQGKTREQQERMMMGQSRDQNEQLAGEKASLMEEYQKLERDLQAAVRANAGTQREASTKLREALGDAQKEEIGLKMKYMTEWLRRGLGPLAWSREAPVTQALEHLSEQVKEAAQSVGQGGTQSAQNGGKEKALSQLEQLRQQLDRASRGQQQGGQQQGSQAGNQPGQQQNGQQAGGQQGQQGQQGQGQGNQPGNGQQQAGMRGGSGERHPGYGAMNNGETQPNIGNAPAPQQSNVGQMQRAYADSLRELRELRQQFGESAPESRDEIDRLIRDMQRIDPSRFPGNPQLVDKMRSQVLPALEQLELQLRRDLDASEGSLARSGSSDKIPQGYSNAVAEYFRKLGKSKP